MTLIFTICVMLVFSGAACASHGNAGPSTQPVVSGSVQNGVDVARDVVTTVAPLVPPPFTAWAFIGVAVLNALSGVLHAVNAAATKKVAVVPPPIPPPIQ